MIDTNFNVEEVLQERLASSLGLDRYKFIMDKVNVVNVSTDEDFQRTFNGFYLVRRNSEWRKVYYDYFESVKGKEISFTEIITYIYENTNFVEPSFSSKMLATLQPDKPIWDRYVMENLGFKLKGDTQEEKLKNAIEIYEKIEKWYDEFMVTPKAKECIVAFDKALPNYTNISNIKKVDAILWSIR